MAAQNELTMAGHAVLTITPPADRPDADPLVPAALNLGWRLAQLYDAPVSRELPARSSGDHLHGVSELSAGERYIILAGQVEAALKTLPAILRPRQRGLPDQDDEWLRCYLMSYVCPSS